MIYGDVNAYHAGVNFSLLPSTTHATKSITMLHRSPKLLYVRLTTHPQVGTTQLLQRPQKHSHQHCRNVSLVFGKAREDVLGNMSMSTGSTISSTMSCTKWNVRIPHRPTNGRRRRCNSQDGKSHPMTDDHQHVISKYANKH